jgi:anti-sigma B factor antagonist
MTSSLSITSQSLADQSVVMLSVAGRLDANTVSQLERALMDAQLSGYRVIVIDLGELTYISSSGLRVLLAGRNNARKRGSTVMLCNLQPAVQEILEMVGFSVIFPIFASREQALAAALTLSDHEH